MHWHRFALHSFPQCDTHTANQMGTKYLWACIWSGYQDLWSTNPNNQIKHTYTVFVAKRSDKRRPKWLVPVSVKSQKETKTTGSKVPTESLKGHRNDQFWTDASPIFLSRRPGRSRAGSSVSGRLVAMIILTCPRASNPSIWFRSSISVLWISLSADVPSENLLPPEKIYTNSSVFETAWNVEMYARTQDISQSESG